MPMPFPIKVAGIELLDVTEVKSNNPNGGSFDVFLTRNQDVTPCYTLTLKLRICLQQINPTPSQVLYGDADDRLFWIRSWSASEWAAFISGAQSQADMWNNNFWLKPPQNCIKFDINYPKMTYRPYIKCALEVDFEADAENAHKTIKVANLDTSKIVGIPDAKTFRSHALLYDSLDKMPVVSFYKDDRGEYQASFSYTIAHEIGHALGLGHIGKLLKTPLCMVAQAANTVVRANTSLTDDGTNSSYCYGYGQPSNIGDNVMGYGAAFSEVNASPWVLAMIKLVGHSYLHWQVLMKVAGNGEWINS